MSELQKRFQVKTLLLVLITGSLLGSLYMMILNRGSMTKILYYESPQGVLERALNDSAEKDYRDTVENHNTRFLIGLSLLLVAMASLGSYIRMSRRSLEAEAF